MPPKKVETVKLRIVGISFKSWKGLSDSSGFKLSGRHAFCQRHATDEGRVLGFGFSVSAQSGPLPVLVLPFQTMNPKF